MDSVDDKTRKAFADQPQVNRLAGFYRGHDGHRALVDVGNGRIPVDFCGFLPELNQPVWVDFFNGRALLIGPSQYLPDRGTFVMTQGGLARVTTDAPAPNDVIWATYPLGQAFSVGQIVKLSWQGGPHVDSVMSTQPAPPYVPPPPSSGTQERELIFTAIDSGSYRSGRWWTNDVWYAENNTPGAWFFGTKIKDSLPDSAEILEVWQYLRVTQASGSSPQIGTHPYAERPPGGFSIASKTTLPKVGSGFRDWVQLPNSVGDFLKSNDGGIGTDGAGLRVFAGINTDVQSGALRIKARY